jgi:hypothetical protein
MSLPAPFPGGARLRFQSAIYQAQPFAHFKFSKTIKQALSTFFL